MNFMLYLNEKNVVDLKYNNLNRTNLLSILGKFNIIISRSGKSLFIVPDKIPCESKS